MSELQTNTLLQGGKYRIEKSLGQGGFGITYLAEQTNLNRKVCIKEFFMKDYSERAETQEDSENTVKLEAGTFSTAKVVGDFRNKFIKEAINIAKLNHPGIVRIHDYFEENGTAYYVMDYIEGENLLTLVKREGPLSEDRAIYYIRQVAEALIYLHGQKLMHLDVKPSNIIIRDSDDKAILIDFGTAKCYDSEGTQTSTAPPIGISAGYAPIEMMKFGGVSTFSPETDVYSLGATLYSLVTGQNPPDASERMEMIMEGEKFKFSKQISTSVANAIESAMQARKQRPKSIAEFVDLLKGETETVNKIERPSKRKTQNPLKNRGGDEPLTEAITEIPPVGGTQTEDGLKVGIGKTSSKVSSKKEVTSKTGMVLCPTCGEVVDFIGLGLEYSDCCPYCGGCLFGSKKATAKRGNVKEKANVSVSQIINAANKNTKAKRDDAEKWESRVEWHGIVELPKKAKSWLWIGSDLVPLTIIFRKNIFLSIWGDLVVKGDKMYFFPLDSKNNRSWGIKVNEIVSCVYTLQGLNLSLLDGKQLKFKDAYGNHIQDDIFRRFVSVINERSKLK